MYVYRIYKKYKKKKKKKKKKKTIFFSKIIQFINIKWQKSWTLSIKIKFSIKNFVSVLNYLQKYKNTPG